MNDAKCDPVGRFFGGTISMDLEAGAGSLYRLDADHAVATVLTGLHIPNGLGWSPDGGRFYLIDSFAGIDAFTFDSATGALSNRQRIIEIEQSDGLADGMTVDEEGYLWVALFNGGELRRYAPDGRLDATLRLPVSQVTSAAFGGPDLRDLYVTTARQDEHGPLSSDRLAGQPLAGSVFRCQPGVRGTPTSRFAG